MAKPGSGPGPHRHPYDEIQFIREGRGAWTVNGKTFEGGAGDIFVIKAGEIHSFKAVGDSPLVQVERPPQPALHSREPMIAAMFRVEAGVVCTLGRCDETALARFGVI